MSDSPAPAQRLDAIDSLRGLIMILMAIDHASLFVAEQHWSEVWGHPLPDYGDGFSLLTRVVSHLCAPGFFLLMGAGMALFAGSRRDRGWSEKEIARHFLVRGLVLIVVELFVVNPAWILGSLDPILRGADVLIPPMPGSGGIPYYNQGVLSALGGAMAAAGLLMRFRPRTSLLLGIGVVGVCQLALPGPGAVDTPFPVPLRILLVAGQTGHAAVLYPLLPWLGVCLIGVALGGGLRADPERFLRLAAPVGGGLLVGFVAVRISGGFGTHHPMPRADWMGLLSVVKYPPSLAFLLLTLGANAVLLGGLAHAPAVASRPLAWLRVYGRSPLFFYVAHLYLYALIGLVLPGSTTLAGMYPVWLLGLVALYPACLRYERFKRGRGVESVWRLF